ARVNSMIWTPENILAMAPDAGSARAGRELSTPRPWSNLGADDRALWGECKGSGKTPYQTQVDRGGPAFQCSCPSRKLPCKHALALFLLWAGAPGDFPTGTPPARVSEWLERRDRRASRKPEGFKLPAEAPPRPAGAAAPAAEGVG